MNGTMWLERELSKLDPTEYWIEYPNKKARTLFPINTGIGRGVKEVEELTYDRTGMSKIQNSTANDIPKLNVTATVSKYPVFYMTVGMDFGLQDLDVAAKLNKSLDTTFLYAAREAHLTKENETAFIGDSEVGISGITNHPNVGDTASANGAGGSPLWTGASAKTSQEVYEDVSTTIDLVNTASKGLHMCTAICFPVSARPQLNQPYNATLTTDSVLTTLKKNYPEVKVWEFSNDLETSGDSSSRVLIAYDMDPRVLELIVPFESEIMPPVELPNNAKAVNSHMGIAGLRIRRPFAIQLFHGF